MQMHPVVAVSREFRGVALSALLIRYSSQGLALPGGLYQGLSLAKSVAAERLACF